MATPSTPAVIKNVIDVNDFDLLRDYLVARPKERLGYDATRGRYLLSRDPIIRFFHWQLVPVARDHFKSASLLPSYALFARYEGPAATLEKHRDDNACTYTLDLCVYQNLQWPLFVVGEPLNLRPNEAAVYFGNEQAHWREPMTDPSGYVGMIFFHFVEPDHWYFRLGPNHINVIRAGR